MTILPHPTDQNESPLDTTNPVVVSADFVLEVSHAHSTANIDFVGVNFYLQSVDDLVQINEDGVAAAARYVRPFSFSLAGTET